MKLFLLLSLPVLLFTTKDRYVLPMPANTADSILSAVHKKLNSVPNLRYSIARELNYSSENYHQVSSWEVYFDFQSNDNLIHCKYQIEDSILKQVFNGTEQFDLNKKAKTINVNEQPKAEAFQSVSAFYNSLLTLRNILPLIINDASATKVASDTIINNAGYKVVTVGLGKRRIQNLGKGFDAMNTKNNFIYRIIVDNKSNLPYAVQQVNDLNADYIKTVFTNINTNAVPPAELSWYYSTYSAEYKPAKPRVDVSLLQPNAVAPDWKLRSNKQDKTVSLKDLQGKVVLLDFWIKNCGPCILSVPHLNELHKKFAGKNVEIISINAYDPKDDVNWFCNKHKVEYDVYLDGKETATKYGVSGFPAFFIIDKEGKVAYSHTGFDTPVKAEIEQLINKYL